MTENIKQINLISPNPERQFRNTSRSRSPIASPITPAISIDTSIMKQKQTQNNENFLTNDFKHLDFRNLSKTNSKNRLSSRQSYNNLKDGTQDNHDTSNMNPLPIKYSSLFSYAAEILDSYENMRVDIAEYLLETVELQDTAMNLEWEKNQLNRGIDALLLENGIEANPYNDGLSYRLSKLRDLSSNNLKNSEKKNLCKNLSSHSSLDNNVKNEEELDQQLNKNQQQEYTIQELMNEFNFQDQEIGKQKVLCEEHKTLLKNVEDNNLAFSIDLDLEKRKNLDLIKNFQKLHDKHVDKCKRYDDLKYDSKQKENKLRKRINNMNYETETKHELIKNKEIEINNDKADLQVQFELISEVANQQKTELELKDTEIFNLEAKYHAMIEDWGTEQQFYHKKISGLQDHIEVLNTQVTQFRNLINTKPVNEYIPSSENSINKIRETENPKPAEKTPDINSVSQYNSSSDSVIKSKIEDKLNSINKTCNNGNLISNSDFTNLYETIDFQQISKLEDTNHNSSICEMPMTKKTHIYNLEIEESRFPAEPDKIGQDSPGISESNTTIFDIYNNKGCNAIQSIKFLLDGYGLSRNSSMKSIRSIESTHDLYNNFKTKPHQNPSLMLKNHSQKTLVDNPLKNISMVRNRSKAHQDHTSKVQKKLSMIKEEKNDGNFLIEEDKVKDMIVECDDDYSPKKRNLPMDVSTQFDMQEIISQNTFIKLIVMLDHYLKKSEESSAPKIWNYWNLAPIEFDMEEEEETFNRFMINFTLIISFLSSLVISDNNFK